LVTAHKKENWGKPLKNLCTALVDLTRAYPDIQIAFPLKYTSEVRDTAFKLLKKKERIHLLDQLPFEAFVEAMAKSLLIITDSDCIKEEGVALKKPVLVFGEAGPSLEELKPDGVKQVGSKTENIVLEASKLIEDQLAYQRMIAGSSPFGDGHAADRIVKAIRSHFGLGERPKEFKAKSDVNSNRRPARAPQTVKFPKPAAV
jgi:UDP-N-acetylglucosamine 2-epimerase (non-hydrolysing)